MMSQPKKYAAFLKAMKKHWPAEVVIQHSPGKAKAQEKAFKEVFGMTLEQVDQAVLKHVKSRF